MEYKPDKCEKLLEAIYEAEQFIKDAKRYIKERNTLIKSRCGDYYTDACNIRGTLVHCSILLAKKLVEWRK